MYSNQLNNQRYQYPPQQPSIFLPTDNDSPIKYHHHEVTSSPVDFPTQSFNMPRGSPAPVNRPERKIDKYAPEAPELLWVTVYGFTPDARNAVVSTLQAIGGLGKIVFGGPRDNFLHAQFINSLSAQKALHQGTIKISGVYVGFVPCTDESIIKKGKIG
eukprot:TRINITY_DN7433_c0_g1_i1.p1 TRINITY_DN7433_c0_g1~~TRINITY_DN7433_c0_g1_i1.p1  ORF type:complete len:159 (+),score=23.49 TRINITY_DN7433_c0_g1_i1:28-504(+)